MKLALESWCLEGVGPPSYGIAVQKVVVVESAVTLSEGGQSRKNGLASNERNLVNLASM